MANISNLQIYDLALEISRDVAELDASIDKLLIDMRALNHEMSLGKQRLARVSQSFSEAFPK
jgi:outer membrane murein-binding lipoprotein Lpp